MRFVFDQKLMTGDYPAAAVFFLVDLIKRMALLSPANEFILLVSSNSVRPQDLPPNMSIEIPPQVMKRFFGPRFHERFELPRFVKRLKADVFVGIDNPFMHRYASGSTLLLLQPHPGKDWSRNLNSVSTVLTFSPQAIAGLNFGTSNIVQFPVPVPPWEMDMAWTEKETIKSEHAGGYDYFLFAADFHPRYHLLDLLKAFSLFKQWQGSGMRLLLAGPDSAFKSAFKEKLETYKFREDVVLLQNPDANQLKRLMGAAYAFLYPASDDPFPINILQAISCGLPVISTDFPVARDWVGDAIQYVTGNLVEGFSSSMRELFNNESKRESLIDKANDLASEDPELLPRQFLRVLAQLSDRK